MSSGRHSNDHEIYNGTSTKGLKLIKNEDGSAMYQVIEDVPQYREPLLYTQANWIDGHGQHDKRNPDAYFEGQSIDTTQEGKVFLGPLINTVNESGNGGNLDSAVVKFCWDPTNSKLLCITSGKAYIYSTVWTAASDTVANATDLIAYGEYMFAARGSSTAYMYSSDGGDNWDASGLTTNTFQKFLVSHNAAGTAEVFWAFKQPNEVYSNTGTGVTTTQWGSANLIGDTADNITNLFLSNDNFMVGRTDGLFHFDSDGGQHQLRPDLRANRSTDNFKYVTEWQAGIYHSEIDGMGEITSYNAYEPMGPLQGLGDIGKRGDVVGLAADKDWLYAAIKDGAASPIYTIYKGREVRKGGELRWQWCPWVYCGTNAVATMLVVQHSATDRRLWFGYGDTTAYVKLADNPSADSTYTYCDEGYLRMSYDYGTDPNWDKLWQSVVVEQHRVAAGVRAVAGANEKVEVKYRDDTDISTGASVVTAYNTAGVVETNLSSALNNKRIQFELHLTSGGSTATPVVTLFQAKGVEKPTTVRIHEATYAIGSEPGKTTETIRAFLRTARTSTTLLKFADLRYGETTGGTAGTDYVYAVMMPGYPKEVEILHEKGDEPELGMVIRLREVSFS